MSDKMLIKVFSFEKPDVWKRKGIKGVFREYFVNTGRVKNRQIRHVNHCQQGSLHVWDRKLRNCRQGGLLIYTCSCATSLTAGLWIPCQHFMIFTRYIHLITRFIETHTITAKPPVVNIGLDHPIHQEIDWTYLNLEGPLLHIPFMLADFLLLCVRQWPLVVRFGVLYGHRTVGVTQLKDGHTRIQGKQQGGKWVMSQTKDINKSTKESIRFHATVLKSIIYLWTLTFLIGDVFPCRHPKRLAQ